MRVSPVVVSICLCLSSIAAVPQTNSEQKASQKADNSHASLLKPSDVATILPSVVFFADRAHQFRPETLAAFVLKTRA